MNTDTVLALNEQSKIGTTGPLNTRTLQTMPSPSLKSATAAAAVVITTGVLIHQRNTITSSYHQHRGIDGILRLLWEGDHLPPHLRQSMDQLEKIEGRMIKSETQLEHIEVLVEKARLDSVDGSTATADADDNNKEDKDKDTLSAEEVKASLFQSNPELRTRIGIFSNKLDTIAAQIDDVKSHSDEEVKQKKKQLSNRIVQLMNEMDGMIASLNLEGR